MNIQALYEYVVLRDILAYILPGGISLAGIALIVQAYGVERWNKVLFSLFDIGSWAFAIALVAIAFLVGHVLDMFYRLLLQGRDWYRRPGTIHKMLTGSRDPAAKMSNDAITRGIRAAVGNFFEVNWSETPVDTWIKSGKGSEATGIMGYWIEKEDPKLFNTEIGRPVVQAHFLHDSGLAFMVFGMCFLIAEAIAWTGLGPGQHVDTLASAVTIGGVWLFGLLLILQGRHKRDILIEHTYRVFYMVWRRKCLGHDAGSQKHPGEAVAETDPFPEDEL